MTLGQILNNIQVGNDLTEEELLNTEVVLDLKDTAGAFRAVGTGINEVSVERKMVWSYMAGAQVTDPKFPKPRIILHSVLVS